MIQEILGEIKYFDQALGESRISQKVYIFRFNEHCPDIKTCTTYRKLRFIKKC